MRYRAYGIDVDSDFAIPALAQRETGDSPSALKLATATPGEIDDRVPAEGGDCVELLRHPGGEVGLRIDHHDSVGYRMDAGAYGLYFLGAETSEVSCAPPEVEPWRRERFLVARVLPLAALLAGHEVLHASGVVLDGSAVAFLGQSGAGKSSVAMRLALRGLPMLTDDLLSISHSEGEVVAHPGTMQVGIRHAEYELLTDVEREGLGHPVDRGDKFYGLIDPPSEPAPLRILYLLQRRRDASGERFVAQESPDPRALLGSTFFAQLELTDMRLLRQMDLCSSLAQQVAVFRAVTPPEVSAASLAAEIEDHARTQLTGARVA
jgi:hypothetical protein